MAEVQHLSKAPIVEGLVDLRCLPTKRLYQVRGALENELKVHFPKVGETRRFEGQSRLEPGKAPVSMGRGGGAHGLRLESADGAELVQLRVDGFTYNRLRPYTNGEQVLSEALRLWSLYARIAGVDEVTRVALRYINRLELPATGLEVLARFLTSPPVAPREVGGVVLDSDRSRRSARALDADTTIVLTQVIERSIKPDTVDVLLDIDVFRLGSFGTKADTLRRVLEGLRALKNKIFFGSITDETVRLYL